MINTQSHCFLRVSVVAGKKLFSQTKTYFCYFNIAFEMSRIVMFLVFGVLNTKYLSFRTPNASTLILG